MKKKGEVRLKGKPNSEGVAIGTPFFLQNFDDDPPPQFPVTVGEVEEEIARYRRALFSSREDLENIQTKLASEGSTEAMSIIDTHIQMLGDPLITTEMEKKIRHTRQNTEAIFRTTLHDYEKRFSNVTNAFFRERLVDVVDVSKRILGHLNPRPKLDFSKIPADSILFAKELTPSDTAALHPSRVRGCVTQREGGQHSHVAVIARSKGIPLVAGVDMKQIEVEKIEVAIVDGTTGDVILNPTQTTLKKYQTQKKGEPRQEKDLKLETSDGERVHLFANVGGIDDLEMMREHGAAGVGLFRSEYLYLEDSTIFYSEEQQYRAYAEMVQKVDSLPITLRVFDVGGDKDPDFFLFSDRSSVDLSTRGIRYLLARREIFHTHLSAILRASQFGNVRLLLPLVGDVSELFEAREALATVSRKLEAKGIAVKSDIPVGCMIESPSAAMLAGALAKESDFLSIGTNDLVQYTLGIDRNRPGNHEDLSVHPSVLRMIKMIVLQSKPFKKPVTVCGEMAANPRYIPLLLGLGITTFSCAPRAIPKVRAAIRATSLREAKKLAHDALEMHTLRDVQRALEASQK
jgi:phosphotransferase system enzyme I (PtsI)